MWRRVVIIALLTALTAAASASAQSDRKNLQIFNDVSKAIFSVSTFSIFDDIAVEVADGTVALSGRVTMPYKRTEIERRVEKIPGVHGVINHITVLPVSPMDDRLRSGIARTIYGHQVFWRYAAMANPPIHIVVENGHVRLTGVVQNNMERMLAQSIAASSPAFSVKCDLKTDAEMRDILEKLR
jgi:hyperosmotically inducible periplasmic protein